MAPGVVRTNGLSWPLHPLQILSWAVVGSDALLFPILCLPLLASMPARVLVGLVFGGSVVLLVYAAAKATLANPVAADVTVEQMAEPKSKPAYCFLCKKNAAARSHHCRECNKCTDMFDHHCKWLNNCIGAGNYHWFLISISSVAVMTGTMLACCVYLFVWHVLGGDEAEDQLQDHQTKEGVLALLAVVIVIHCPLFLLDCQLIFLHIYLSAKHMTTYEYIVFKHHQMKAAPPHQEGQPWKNLQTLPRCLDWIVFQPRRKKKPVAEQPPAKAELGLLPQAKKAPFEAAGTSSASSWGGKKHKAGTVVPASAADLFGAPPAGSNAFAGPVGAGQAGFPGQITVAIGVPVQHPDAYPPAEGRIGALAPADYPMVPTGTDSLPCVRSEGDVEQRQQQQQNLE